LKYADHDLNDTEKFPRFKPYNYLRSEHDGEVTFPFGWAESIYKSTILNTLRLPHFRRSPEVNFVVKVMMSRMHGGYLWMDSRISLDPHLIWRLTKLSKRGLDSLTVFVGKTQDKQFTDTLKKQFDLKKIGRGYEIDSINNEATTFAT